MNDSKKLSKEMIAEILKAVKEVLTGKVRSDLYVVQFYWYAVLESKPEDTVTIAFTSENEEHIDKLIEWLSRLKKTKVTN